MSIRWPFGLVTTWALLAVWALTGWIAWNAGDRTVPTVYVKYQVLNPVVSEGDLLRIKWLLRRSRNDCIFQRIEIVFDGANTRFIKAEAVIEQPGPVGEEEYVTATKIPEGAIEGEGTYRLILQYECNFIQRWWPLVYRQPDIHFQIVKKKGAA